MVVRQHGDRTQIAVLEDGVLVEHYVDRASHQSYVGNVYLGKVQNVLPSMEAAFVDIGKGRNAVLYAGEVNFDASGLEGESKRIESALKSGQSIMVQVTKDPIGHKGARLTSQVSLPGRYLVYVPGASMTGISRKLPDTERNRLKQILKKVMPENAGVIVRTAAEGASEEELSHDVARLAAQWEAIEAQGQDGQRARPALRRARPDASGWSGTSSTRTSRSLVIASDSEWDLVDEYVRYVAPHLAERMERWDDDKDVFAAYRIDEQLAKALDRKVWLPSGGSLVIDTTEAMTVIDVNTGKFTGSGRQPGADRHQEQPGGGRGDRPPAAAARHRRHHRHRLHRHGAGEQPRAGAAPADRVPGPGPDQAPGGRGDLAGPGPDDQEAGRLRAARGVLRAVRALQRPRRARLDRARPSCHPHGRNGSRPERRSQGRPGPGRRSKATPQVAAKTVEPGGGRRRRPRSADGARREAVPRRPARGEMPAAAGGEQRRRDSRPQSRRHGGRRRVAGRRSAIGAAGHAGAADPAARRAQRRRSAHRPSAGPDGPDQREPEARRARTPRRAQRPGRRQAAADGRTARPGPRPSDRPPAAPQAGRPGRAAAAEPVTGPAGGRQRSDGAGRAELTGRRLR